jgi:thioredoxin 1
MSALPKVSDSSFDQEVLQSDLPVLVDFSAEWCGPCKSLAPIVENLAEEYSGRVKFVQLDIDENRQTPSSFGVMAVPTLILFKGGEVVDKVTGFKPKAVLTQHIEKLVS